MRFEDLNHKEYEIIERLGGNVLYGTYLARQVNLGRYVTIRCLPTPHAFATQRFANELSALATLSHPNNRRVIDAGAAALEGISGPYVVFDYLYGAPLSTVLEGSSPLETAEVIRIGRQLLGALAEAHRGGMLHRQLSPHALMLCQHHGAADHLVVVDYALEQTLDPERWLEVLRSQPEIAAFAAPEVLAGEPPSVRADLYSAAAVLYRCAVGNTFSAASDTDLELRLPTRDRLAQLHGALIEVIDRALSVQPTDRYASAHDFLEALEPVFQKAHAAAAMPPSMSSFTQRPVVGARAEEVSASLSEAPSVWILTEDPALDFEFLQRLRRLTAHYSVAEVVPSEAGAWADALASGAVRQPWLVVFGDIHVIVQNPLLATLRDLSITQRMLVSARLNGAMLEAAVNYCGVDRHIVRPVEDAALSEAIEAQMADCRRQLLRQEALRHLPRGEHPSELAARRQSLTGTFAAETR